MIGECDTSHTCHHVLDQNEPVMGIQFMDISTVYGFAIACADLFISTSDRSRNPTHLLSIYIQGRSLKKTNPRSAGHWESSSQTMVAGQFDLVDTLHPHLQEIYTRIAYSQSSFQTMCHFGADLLHRLKWRFPEIGVPRVPSSISRWDFP